MTVNSAKIAAHDGVGKRNCRLDITHILKSQLLIVAMFKTSLCQATMNREIFLNYRCRGLNIPLIYAPAPIV